MSGIDDSYLVQLLQFHVVAFGVDDQNAVAGQDPLLCHEPDQVTLARPGGPDNQNAALASGYLRGRSVLKGADVDPPARRAPASCPTQVRAGQQINDTISVGVVMHKISMLAHRRDGVGHRDTDLCRREQRQVVFGITLPRSCCAPRGSAQSAPRPARSLS